MPRKRRTAEEARRVILDAAERRLTEVGPAGLRLAEVAADVGVSHPAILHHFGSREALIDAVIERAIESLELELVEIIAAQPGDVQTTEVLDKVFAVFATDGQARLLAWLLLSGGFDQGPMDEGGTLHKVAQAVHARRVQRDPSSASRFEDTQFTVLLAALALFGEAIAGKVMRRSAGLGQDGEAASRYREWLAELLLRHVVVDREA